MPDDIDNKEAKDSADVETDTVTTDADTAEKETTPDTTDTPTDAADAAAQDDAQKTEDTAKETPDELPWGSTTNDEVGDSVLRLLHSSGMSADEAKSLMFEAARTHDVTKIDQATLVEKVGKDKAALIMAGAENYLSRAKAKTETILNVVHAEAGGEANWKKVTTWAQENITDADRAEYADLIDAGGAKARFAAQEIVSRFNADKNNTSISKDGEITADGGPAVDKAKKLTKAQYVDAITKAYNSGATEKEINAIKAARQRGRAAGI